MAGVRSIGWVRAPRRASKLFRKKADAAPASKGRVCAPPPESRSFLGYGFVWTGADMEGFLVPVGAVDLVQVYAQRPETAGLSADVIGGAADMLGAALSVPLGGLVRALRDVWGTTSRQEFDERVLVHLLHLDEWRAAVRAPADAEAALAAGAGTFSLLEIGRQERRSPFCALNAVPAAAFDFRLPGQDKRLGQAATAKESSAQISCAAMILLLQLQDAIGDGLAICSICNQLSAAAKKILQLRGEIMRLYDPAMAAD